MDLLLREYLQAGYEPYSLRRRADPRAHGQRRHLRSSRRRICRYSTDPKWLVPHFEKMLYDQGLVASIYVDGLAGHRTRRPQSGSAPTAPAASATTFCATYAAPTARSIRARTPTAKGSKASSTSGPRRGLTILGEKAARLFCHRTTTSASIGNWGHPGDDHVPHGPKNILQSTVRPRSSQSSRTRNRRRRRVDRRIAAQAL